jgi:hypothetical protein
MTPYVINDTLCHLCHKVTTLVDSNKKNLTRWTVFFAASDIDAMSNIEKETGINGQEYMRALLSAFVRNYKRNEEVSLPLYILTKKQMKQLKQDIDYES